MTEVNNNANEVKENKVRTISRRGVASAIGTTRLKFSEDLAKPNGLFLAHLDSVVVSTVTIGEDKTGMPSFNGFEIPKITLTFASNEEEPNKRHYINLQFMAVESNVNTIPGGTDEWKVNSVLDWFKHVLDVFVLKGRELTEEEANALSLPFVDFDENGEYVSVETETVIAGWKTLFENFENIINRGREGQPYYKTKDNKFITVWIKLLRYIKITNKKKGSYWSPIANGDLAFPSFVGEGCIELFKQNTPTSIRVNVVKECIKPMNIEKPKTPNMPMPGMSNTAPAMGGIPVGDNMMGNMGGYNEVMNAAQEDMPF